MEMPKTLKPPPPTTTTPTSTSTVEFPFCSHAHHRRSRLKSETYRTLLRIVSYCRDHPQLLQTPPPGNATGEAREETREASENVEFVQPSNGSDELEKVMGLDRGVGNGSDGAGLRGGEVEVGPLVVDELEHVIRENDHSNNRSQFQSSSGNGCGENCQSPGSKNCADGNEPVYSSTLGGSEMNKYGREKLACTDGKMDSLNLLLGDGKMEEGEISGESRLLGLVPEVDAGSKEKAVGVQPVGVGVRVKNGFSFDGKTETNLKNKGTDYVMTHHQDNANKGKELNCMDILRNEMPCDRKVVVYEDPIFAEDMGHSGKRKRDSVGTEKRKHHKSKKQCHGSGAQDQMKGCGVEDQMKGSGVEDQMKGSGVEDQMKGSAVNDQMKGSGAKNQKQKPVSVAKEQEERGVLKNGTGCEVASSNCLDLQVEKLDQTVRGSVQIEVNKPKDDGPCNKKKRAPPSAAKKAKKKQRERKRRAERNQELGVKRLKLKPVVKQKPVTFCRHYLMGRCQLGEKCKYSHDTTPLTKSKPCCHFARHSCMKGDDCPFDHQLSRYPCDNYSSKGSCSRGESCLFSHKLPSKEESPSSSNASKPLSLPSAPNSKMLLDNSGTSQGTPGSVSNPKKVVPLENAESNAPKDALKRPAHPPKGISFIPTGKSSASGSANPKLNHNSSRVDQSVKVGSQDDQNALKMDKKIETPKQTPSTNAPVGINFLSFGKSPHNSSLKEMIKKSSSSTSFSMHKELSSSSYVYNNTQVVKQSSQVVKPNPFSSGGNLAHSGSNLESSLVSHVDGGGPSRSVQMSKNWPDDRQNSSPIRCKLQTSPFASAAGHSMQAYLKNTPNTPQKTLLSTLAFAEGLNSKQKMKQSINWL